MDVIRERIQLLCRTVAPLGKVMDYVQEDVDAMNREMDVWRKERIKYEKLYEEQVKYQITTNSPIRLTNESLVPLHAQIQQIEAQIVAQVHFKSLTFHRKKLFVETRKAFFN
jgi:TRAF3-interacting protein 1